MLYRHSAFCYDKLIASYIESQGVGTRGQTAAQAVAMNMKCHACRSSSYTHEKPFRETFQPGHWLVLRAGEHP